MKTVGVTGANGYVGSLISDAFAADGCSVVPLVRPGRLSTANGHGAARSWELGDPNPDLAGLDVLIHAAWDLTLLKLDDIQRVNVAASIELARQAKAAGVQQFVFISSMSAYEGTQQKYGLAKLAVEEVVLEHGGLVIRPGLVWGPEPRGMAGALVKLFRWRVIPIIARHERQFPVHEDDLASCVVRLVGASVRGVVGVAQPRAVAFDTFLRHVAGTSRVPVMVPVPWRLVYGTLRLAEAAGATLAFRADSVLGLVRPAGFVPGALELEELGMSVRAVL